MDSRLQDISPRMQKAIVVLAATAIILAGLLIAALLSRKRESGTERDLPAETAEEFSVRMNSEVSACVAKRLEHAPFTCDLGDAEYQMGWLKLVITLETTNAVAEETTLDDLRELWRVLEPCVRSTRAWVVLETPTPGAPRWGFITAERREHTWDLDVDTWDFAINHPPYYFVDAIDRSVDGQQCMIVTLPMVNRISRQLDQLGWAIESRTESLFDAKPNISGLSMSVSLTPESASVSQWTPDDVNRFLRISRIVSAELGIATALEEKLNSVIGSPKYYRANNGDFVQWIWILNGLEVCYSHSSSLDILDVTYAEPSRRSSPVAD